MAEEIRVDCRFCRFMSRVTVDSDEPSLQAGREVQCPSCENWNPAVPALPPSPAVAEDVDDVDDEPGIIIREPELIKKAEALFRPVHANAGHPALRWFVSIGNGIFEDDYSTAGLPGPAVIYRFTRDRFSAYVWQADGKWLVRPWCSMRRSWAVPGIESVESFRAALARLAETADG